MSRSFLFESSCDISRQADQTIQGVYQRKRRIIMNSKYVYVTALLTSIRLLGQFLSNSLSDQGKQLCSFVCIPKIVGVYTRRIHEHLDLFFDRTPISIQSLFLPSFFAGIFNTNAITLIGKNESVYSGFGFRYLFSQEG